LEKVLITGANGYIGSNLASALDKTDYELHLLSRSKSNRDKHAYVADITDHLKIGKIVTEVKPEIVIHLAATGFNQAINLNLDELINVNFLATKNLIETSRKMQVRRFIYATTYMECQGSQKAIRSDDMMRPQSEYALSKSLSTDLLISFSKVHGFDSTVLRFFSVYGKNDLKFRFIPSVFDALMNNKILETTSLRQQRDFVYITDVIEAIINSVEADKTSQIIYNVGTGQPVPLMDVAQKIKLLCPESKGEIKIGAKPDRPNEEMCYFADISGTSRDLRWAPRYSLDMGLKDTKDFLISHMMEPVGYKDF
jgi:UDP-glucose 4-epimerase